MFYPQDFESRLGFDRVREDIRRRTLSSVAKELVDAMEMMYDFNSVRYELERTQEMKVCVEMESDFPGGGYRDTRFMKRARVVGNFLEGDELLNLGKALECAMALQGFFTAGEEVQYPHLRAMAQQVEVHGDVLREVHRIIDEFGRVRDNASSELAQIRRDLQVKSNRIGSVLQRILRQAQTDGYADAEASVNIRDGRAVIPVTAGHKRKVQGFVQGESATGKTAYIEPLEVVELNNEVRELENAEKREVVRILTLFTDWVRPMVDDIMATGDFVGEIDFLSAKAKYAVKTSSTLPILEKDTQIYLREARHPILEEHLKEEGRKIVPLDLRLDKKKHILLISGPNAGGKSVCLKTVGLLQYMLQCGVLVPTKENSQMSVFQSIMLDIGDQQSLDNDLSTYSSHLTNMKHFLRYADKNSLVLIDEFGGGTEPNIGGAIAESVLEQLRSRGTFGVITTHYANLKYYGAAAEGVENGAMTFDVQRIAPLFSLEQGRAGSSFALEIARKIGLPETILKEAQEKVGIDQVHIEKQLREAARDKRYWETKRERIRQAEKGVERTAEQYETELSKLQEQRTQILKKAKEEAAKILSEANRQIENTIREIKEAQAEKERTRVAREGFNTFRDGVAAVGEKDGVADDIALRMQKLREKQERRAQNAARRKEEAQNQPKVATPVKPKEIEVGMKVKMVGQSVVGDIVSINGNNAQVEFSGLRMRVDKRKLQPATADEIRKGEVRQTQNMAGTTATVGAGYDTLKKRTEFQDTIDLRGMRGAEALDVVRLFIDEAIMFGVGQVRILHGKGTGMLKQQIREYLNSEPAVRSAKDEHEDFGGAGITVVKF